MRLSLAAKLKTSAFNRAARSGYPEIHKTHVRYDAELAKVATGPEIESVAIDGSKFKAVNNRDKNFTSAKIERRRKQLEESVSRYLSQLDTADRGSVGDADVKEGTDQ